MQVDFRAKKPLVENTLRRITKGMDKFVIKNPNPFIVTVNHGGNGFRGQSISDPLKTVTSKHGYGVVVPSLIQYHSETAKSEVRGQSVCQHLMTVDASPRYAVTSANIIKYYGGDSCSAADEPLHTITTKERHALIKHYLCVFRNNQDCKSLTEPLPTECTSAGHFALINTEIVKYGEGTQLGHWQDVRAMLNNYCGYELADNEVLLLLIDCERYFIADIGMRMLEPRELYRAQGFPDDYIIDFDVNGKNIAARRKLRDVVTQCLRRLQKH